MAVRSRTMKGTHLNCVLLAALAGNGLILSTIAEITFYGHDETGRAVSAVGNIGISFANFGD